MFVSKISKIIVFVSIVLIFIGCSNDSKEEEKTVKTKPTKEDIRNFIRDKTVIKWTDNTGGFKRQEVVFSGCLMKVVTTYSEYDLTDVFGGAEKDNFIDLKYLDPTRIETNTQSVDIILYTKAEKKLVKYYSNGKYMDSRNYIDFHVLSPDYNAPKVAKAFKQLIQMCGGKGELF